MNNTHAGEYRLPHPLWRLAFRPFFLGAALFSIIAVLCWGFYWQAPFAWQPVGGPLWWHGHEMIFGYGCAVVAGFLLTAVQTWTGVPGFRGRPLIALFLLWLLARLLIAFPVDLAMVCVAVIDVSFLVVAAAVMARSVWAVKQWRNAPFIVILLVLASLNALSYTALSRDDFSQAQLHLHSAILLISLIILVVGGRVIPMFTANGTGTKKVEPLLWLEILSLASMVAVIVCSLIANDGPLPGALYLIAAVSNAWRFLRWRFFNCWRQPLLWSLHLSFAFIPLGLLALALESVDLWPNGSAALHALTVGAMGSMILAMIARVSLGHTGRPLQAPKAMSLAFFLILIAGLFRAVLPVVLPAAATLTIMLAALCWALAYGIFIGYYGPMLYAARVDGKVG